MPPDIHASCRGVHRASHYRFDDDEFWTGIEKGGHIELFPAESIYPDHVRHVFGSDAAQEFVSVMHHIREYRKFYQLYEKSKVRESCLYGENVVYSNGNYYWKDNGVLTPIGGTYDHIVNYIFQSVKKVWTWMCDHPTPLHEYTMPFCTFSPGCESPR